METPALSMHQLCDILEKTRSTIYEHMRLLQARDALRWRPGGKSEIIVVFPQDDELLLSEYSDRLDPPLLFDSSSENTRAIDSTVRNSGKLDSHKKSRESIPAVVRKPFVNSLAEITGMQAGLGARAG